MSTFITSDNETKGFYLHQHDYKEQTHANYKLSNIFNVAVFIKKETMPTQIAITLRLYIQILCRFRSVSFSSNLTKYIASIYLQRTKFNIQLVM